MESTQALLDSKPQLYFRKQMASQDQTIETTTQELPELTKEQLLKYDPNPTLRLFENGKYEYIDTEQALQELVKVSLEKETALGIDIEQTHKNTYYGYVCLVQISTRMKDYIIDGIRLHSVIPKHLGPIFANPDIAKVFYSGTSDLLWLSRDFGIHVVNYFDVHAASVFLEKIRDSSLVGLLAEYCNYSLDKSIKKKFQLSDWRQRPLTPDQLEYAALDAHYLVYLRNRILSKLEKKVEWENGLGTFLQTMQNVCLKRWEPKLLSLGSYEEYFINYIQKEKKKGKNETLKKTDKSEISAEYYDEFCKFLNLVELREQAGLELDDQPELLMSNEQLAKLVIGAEETKQEEEEKSQTGDGLFIKIYNAQIKDILSGKSVKKYTLGMHKNTTDLKTEAKLMRQNQFKNKYTTKGKAYQNCRILAPDNELLCYCNMDKIDWYMSRNLAEIIKDNPMTIKLKFEPSGRGWTQLNELKVSYDTQKIPSRVNQCVVCGQKENYLRYHIVPLLYRIHFPEDMKSHNAYDVLLLCWRCLEKANRHSEKKKQQIANKYNVPLQQFNEAVKLKNYIEGLTKSIINYRKFKATMPEDRRQKLVDGFFELYDKIVKESDHLQEHFREELLKLEKDEKGKIVINEKFEEFFLQVPNYKKIVKKSSNKDFKNIHGKLVIEQFESRGKIDLFVQEWRQFFLDSMDPQFLPQDWLMTLEKKAKESLQKESQEKELQITESK